MARVCGGVSLDMPRDLNTSFIFSGTSRSSTLMVTLSNSDLKHVTRYLLALNTVAVGAYRYMLYRLGYKRERRVKVIVQVG